MRTRFAAHCGGLGLFTLSIVFALGISSLTVPLWAYITLMWIGLLLCATSFMAVATQEPDGG